MAIVNFNKKLFEQEIGTLDSNMQNRVAMFGTPVESVGGEEIQIEVFPNRPDLLSYSGFRRSFLAFLEKKYIKSFTALILSIAIKYATVFLIPGIIVYGLFKSSKDFFLYVLILSMIITVVLASSRTNFQPWYLLLVLPFASLVSDKYFILIPVFLISIASLLQYAPFIYLGNWNPPVPTILNWIMISSIMVSGVLIIGRKLMHR